MLIAVIRLPVEMTTSFVDRTSGSAHIDESAKQMHITRVNLWLDKEIISIHSMSILKVHLIKYWTCLLVIDITRVRKVLDDIAESAKPDAVVKPPIKPAGAHRWSN